MTVREMLSRMSSSEFSEWMAYYNIEPFGPIREDLRAGMIAAPLLNIWVPRGGTRAKPSDWIMRFDKAAEEQDWETMKAMLQGFTAAMKARAKGGKMPPKQPCTRKARRCRP